MGQREFLEEEMKNDVKYSFIVLSKPSYFW